MNANDRSRVANEIKERRGQATEEINRVYARVESLGVRVVLVGVLAAFFLYLTGWVEAFIPPHKLPNIIGRGVKTFIQENNAPAGWEILGMLNYSDALSLTTLILLVGIIVAAYLTMIPVLIRRREGIYLGLVLIQVLLFLIAGLGGSAGGH